MASPRPRPEASGGRDDGFGRRMLGGTLWMVSMRWTIRLIGLLNTAIIARVLMPGDFGVVAFAMIAVDLLITVTDGDIEMALVRSAEIPREFKDTGWTLKILAGLLTFLALWGLAPVIARYFGDARVATVIGIAALRPLILGFENIGVVEFRRGLRFETEFRYLVLQKLIGFAAGLCLVFGFRNYLALAWAGPVSALVTVALSYRVHPFRPRLSLVHWHNLWLFSRWQMLFNAARLCGERCDQFIIGALAGAEETGIYAVGFDLALMPSREIMLPAGRALMPLYARVAGDETELPAAFRSVLGFAVIIAGAVGTGVSCVAEDAVHVILGESWDRAVPFVRLLGIFSSLEGIWLMLDPCLIAARRERSLAIANLVFAGATIPIVALSAGLFGIETIPSARIAVISALLGGVFLRIAEWRWVTPAGLLTVSWRPLAAALGMAVAVRLGHGAVFATPFLSLLSDVTVGAVTYPAVLFGLWHLSGRGEGTERLLASLVAARFAR